MTKNAAPYILSGNKQFCNYCPGFCCYRLEGSTLYLDNLDINRLARHFHLTDGEVRGRYLEDKNTFKVRGDGSCIFLKNNKMHARCSIHEARPQQCRGFPYNQPCPYLESHTLLAKIQPRIQQGLAGLLIEPTTPE